jgi:F420-non-reducing hydrogenase large subunit
VQKAAEGVIKPGKPVTQGLLNQVEMAFRAYDPCFGCSTHAMPGQLPLTINLLDADGNLITVLSRDENGRVTTTEVEGL